MLHTKYWAVALGEDYRDALDNGVVMAATRFCHGDDYTDGDVDRVRRRPRDAASVAFAAALRAEMGDHGGRIQALAALAGCQDALGRADGAAGIRTRIAVLERWSG